MLGRYNMIGPNADRPLIERIERAASFSQTIPAEFVPLPPLENPDPVGNTLGAPKAPGPQKALEVVAKMLIDSPQSPERDALIHEWFAMSERVEQFLAEAKEKRKADLNRQIAELTPLCRASLDRIQALRAEAGGLRNRMNAQKERYSAANVKLRVAMGNKPDDESFPTEEELAAWDASVAKVRAAAEREAESKAALQQLIDSKAMEIQLEEQRLTELKQRRTDCKDELAGRQRKGAFGLQVPAV